MSDFKPMLAPNEAVDLTSIRYPVLASNKLDGIRCIFLKGQILSRSLKPIVNIQLRERFEPIRKWTEATGNILDGEIYSPDITFQQITSFVMTEDLYKPKVGKSDGLKTLPDHLKFYCFDALYGGQQHHGFHERINMAKDVSEMFPNIMVWVEHDLLNNEIEIQKHFSFALKAGCEGLMLRDPMGQYKFGRGTLKEGLIYKVKPFVTFDAQVTGVVQSTEVDPKAEKKINELGRSVTSKKKGDRIAIEKASAFWVKYQGQDLKVCLACTDEEKEEIWNSQEKYIGKWIEYKGMLVGAKDLPRHPVMIRFREDKQ